MCKTILYIWDNKQNLTLIKMRRKADSDKN